MSVFDGLPDIFVDTLGEPVIYSRDGQVLTSPTAAIWQEEPLDVALAGELTVDSSRTTLSVRADDVTPIEGDLVTRVADGKVMMVTTPIHPDGKGMIRCNLGVAT